jgi:hypothetical protein
LVFGGGAGTPAACISRLLQAHADDTTFHDAVRITHKSADGSLATTTVSFMHLMHVINNPGPSARAATPKARRYLTLYLVSQGCGIQTCTASDFAAS